MMTPFSARCEQMSCQGQTLMDGSRSLRRAETAVTKRHQRCNEPPRSPWPRRAARRYKPGMNHEQILCRREGSVATIVLNRPEKLNAFTFRMLAEIHAALDTLPFDDLRALVFTGAGRAFSAGDDLIDMGGTDPAEDIRRGHHRLVTRLRGARVPVIAALNGYTLGAAFDLALACDFRIAAADAELGDVRVPRAMCSMSGAAFWLPRLVGLGPALEILLLGERIRHRARWRSAWSIASCHKRSSRRPWRRSSTACSLSLPGRSGRRR